MGVWWGASLIEARGGRRFVVEVRAFLTAMVNRQAVQGKLEERLSRTPGRAGTLIIDQVVGLVALVSST